MLLLLNTLGICWYIGDCAIIYAYLVFATIAGNCIDKNTHLKIMLYKVILDRVAITLLPLSIYSDFGRETNHHVLVLRLHAKFSLCLKHGATQKWID